MKWAAQERFHRITKMVEVGAAVVNSNNGGSETKGSWDWAEKEQNLDRERDSSGEGKQQEIP